MPKRARPQVQRRSRAKRSTGGGLAEGRRLSSCGRRPAGRAAAEKAAKAEAKAAAKQLKAVAKAQKLLAKAKAKGRKSEAARVKALAFVEKAEAAAEVTASAHAAYIFAATPFAASAPWRSAIKPMLDYANVILKLCKNKK